MTTEAIEECDVKKTFQVHFFAGRCVFFIFFSEKHYSIYIMRRTILIVFVSLLATVAFSQQKADIIASYQESWRDWQSDTLKTVGMTLLANNNESKYFNDLSLWSDSLSSTPDGKAQLQQIIMAACMTQHPDGSISVDLRKGPVKKVDTYVFSNLADATITCYDNFAGELSCYTEPMDEMQWEIGDSSRVVLGYECMQATTDYHGRRWTGWFAPEIPVFVGPWKLHGLPGLILEAVADNGISYQATGIEPTERTITPMYSSDSYQRVDRKRALADEEHYRNNMEAMVRARYGATVKFENITERPKYDAQRYAAEPDYAE